MVKTHVDSIIWNYSQKLKVVNIKNLNKTLIWFPSKTKVILSNIISHSNWELHIMVLKESQINKIATFLIPSTLVQKCLGKNNKMNLQMISSETVWTWVKTNKKEELETLTDQSTSQMIYTLTAIICQGLLHN